MAKLTKQEKQEHKERKAYFTLKNGVVLRVGRVTIVGYVTGSGRGQFSLSICSPDEKMSRKRGELMALRRYAYGRYLPFEFIQNFEYETLRGIARSMAEYSGM